MIAHIVLHSGSLEKHDNSDTIHGFGAARIALQRWPGDCSVACCVIASRENISLSRGQRAGRISSSILRRSRLAPRSTPSPR